MNILDENHYWTSKDYDSRNYKMKDGFEHLHKSVCKLCGLKFEIITRKVLEKVNYTKENRKERLTDTNVDFPFIKNKKTEYITVDKMIDKNKLMDLLMNKARSIIYPKYRECDGHKEIIETSDIDFVNWLLTKGYTIYNIFSIGREQGEMNASPQTPIMSHGFFSSKVIGMEGGGAHAENQRHDVSLYIMKKLTK